MKRKPDKLYAMPIPTGAKEMHRQGFCFIFGGVCCTPGHPGVTNEQSAGVAAGLAAMEKP